jgi:NADH-quinone oxidoreductase subunit N
LSLAIILVAKQKFIYRNTITCKIDVFLIFGFALFFIFLLTSSYNFFAMFLAIEGLGLTLYTLAGLLHTSVVSIESALKYYALGALSTGIMLFGLSILFGIVGSLDFLQVKIFLELFSTTKNIEVKFSFLAIMFGFLFKIAAFPCHVWVADIYEGL